MQLYNSLGPQFQSTKVISPTLRQFPLFVGSILLLFVYIPTAGHKFWRKELFMPLVLPKYQIKFDMRKESDNFWHCTVSDMIKWRGNVN